MIDAADTVEPQPLRAAHARSFAVGFAAGFDEALALVVRDSSLLRRTAHYQGPLPDELVFWVARARYGISDDEAERLATGLAEAILR